GGGGRGGAGEREGSRAEVQGRQDGVVERRAQRVLTRASARLRHGGDRMAPAVSAGPRRRARARPLETFPRLRTGARRPDRGSADEPVGAPPGPRPPPPAVPPEGGPA